MLPDFPPDDEKFMRLALAEAWAAYEDGEVPVGAIVVHQDRVIGRGYNQRETLNDPTAHAEMIAITAAATHLQSWRLEHCTVYVTLEPCPMCAGALVQARVSRVVYGAPDPKAGACETLYNILSDDRLNHQAEIKDLVLAGECASVLQQFFAEQRAKGKK